MKIFLATCGSRGDVQPVMALALALKDAGHNVLLAAPPENSEWAKRYGCPFHPVGNSVEDVLESCRDLHTYKPVFKFMGFLRREVKNQFIQFPSLVMGADLVLGISLNFGLASVAESLGIPYAFIALTPQLLPSGYHPYLAIKNHNLPHWLNRFSWESAIWLDNFNMKALVNRKRKSLGLKSISDVWRHILGRHVIVASDKVLGNVPPDVGQIYTQTGYFHLAQPDGLDPRVRSYIESGPRPIYVGFGSVPSSDQRAMESLIFKAADLTSVRLIMFRSRQNSKDVIIKNGCCFIGRLPHTSLFRHVSAVIHHGGTGTTATAARAGVPQIIIPHLLDQFYWAKRIYISGIGPKPVPRSRLNPTRLANAMAECITNGEMRHKAKEVAGTIRNNNSLRSAVELIESGDLMRRPERKTSAG
jgi:UDP:flavonoid glycosyltransferase YjiC (YdhE family)